MFTKASTRGDHFGMMASLMAAFLMSIIIAHLHNPNISLNHQKATPVEYARYAFNEANLLASLMVDPAIIKAAISSVETFDGNKKIFKHG